ncbi:MAG: 2-oxoacid:ferredoxin oxidoreductase subunit beta [Chloroflexi bacterium]|nr:2-oxoacid:ferredoxin oxidoreductase subunit beta [Chloroflexota bacterium]
MADTATLQFTVDDYKSSEKPTWCPGCGDFGVLNALYHAMREKNYNPKDVVLVSGIGCSSRLPFFVATYGFHGVHGRAMPIATGVKVARPDLHVLVLGGDGDAFAIGGGHFMHAARRNLNVTYVIMDNQTYGLTKGQASPTAQRGYVHKAAPKGTLEEPVNPLLLAMACGASFVARGFSGQPKDLAQLILAGIEHQGLAIIDTYSPCPTFNKVNTFKTYREEVAPLPPDHDPTNFEAALKIAASPMPRYLGVIYRREGPSYEQLLEQRKTGTEADLPQLLDSLFDRFS